MLDQFEAMTLGPCGPGQQLEATADPAYYPRPTGAEAEGAGALIVLIPPYKFTLESLRGFLGPARRGCWTSLRR